MTCGPSSKFAKFYASYRTSAARPMNSAIFPFLLHANSFDFVTFVAVAIGNHLRLNQQLSEDDTKFFVNGRRIQSALLKN
jgi:hypothetical protein